MADLREQLSRALAGHYAIERELGRGGMATVFRAQDLRHQRPVALKVLDPDLAAALGPERFLREIRIEAGLEHPHIVPLFDSGVADGLLYYVMPCIEGDSLRQRLEREKQLPVEEALRITGELAEALACAHGHGIVHRDLKPENVLFSGPHALLADFGIARAVHAAGGETLTATGVTIGTPAYLSPEQAAGGTVDARSDQYALACVVYEMLAGQPPFTGPTAESIAHQHLAVAPRPVTELRPAVTQALAKALARALAKSPADRYASVAEFSAALAEAARTPDAEPAPPAQPWWRTRRAAAAALALMAVAIVTLAIVVPRVSRRSAPALSPQAVTSLVALPCKVYGGPEVAYLADAVPATMSSHLGGIPGVTTKLPPASVDVEKVHGDLARIARVMGVGAFVNSSVVMDARRLSLNVHLVDAATGQVLWTRAFQGTPDSFLAVVQEAAQAIRGALRPTAPLPDRRAGPAGASQAELAYREGQFYSRRYNNQHEPADFDRALQAFQRSMALDSGYADAAAEISRLHGFRFEAGLISQDEAAAQARKWAGLALRLDPRNGKAFGELCWAEMCSKAQGTERMLELALKGAALAPEDAISQLTLGMVVSEFSLTLGTASIRRSATLDPFYVYAGLNLAALLERQGLHADALRLADQALLVEPGLSGGLEVKSSALIGLARSQEAEPLLRQLEADAAAGRWDKERARYVAEALAMGSGDRGALDRAIAHVRGAIEDPGLHSYLRWMALDLVPLIARSGRHSESLAILEAYARRWPLPPEFLESPSEFAPLRSDPRFQALVARAHDHALRWLRLVEQARARGEVPDYLLPVFEEVRGRLVSAG